MKDKTKTTKRKADAHPRALSLDERLERLVKSSEAGEREMAEMRRKSEAAERESKRQIAEIQRESKAADQRVDKEIKEMRRKSEAAERRMDRMLDRMSEDHKKNEGHRRNLSRVMEDSFAASLPRVMEDAHRIIIRHDDIRMRVRKSNHTREYDFIAPNGNLVLVGEVKTRLTRADVLDFLGSISCDFRTLFPEYKGMPVYGVVAGVGIDKDAANLACKQGFYILRMEGSELHPDTKDNYTATEY